jgi:hypothetical protein
MQQTAAELAPKPRRTMKRLTLDVLVVIASPAAASAAQDVAAGKTSFNRWVCHAIGTVPRTRSARSSTD